MQTHIRTVAYGVLGLGRQTEQSVVIDVCAAQLNQSGFPNR